MHFLVATIQYGVALVGVTLAPPYENA